MTKIQAVYPQKRKLGPAIICQSHRTLLATLNEAIFGLEDIFVAFPTSTRENKGT